MLLGLNCIVTKCPGAGNELIGPNPNGGPAQRRRLCFPSVVSKPCPHPPLSSQDPLEAEAGPFKSPRALACSHGHTGGGAAWRRPTSSRAHGSRHRRCPGLPGNPHLPDGAEPAPQIVWGRWALECRGKRPLEGLAPDDDRINSAPGLQGPPPYLRALLHHGCWPSPPPPRSWTFLSPFSSTHGSQEAFRTPPAGNPPILGLITLGFCARIFMVCL